MLPTETPFGVLTILAFDFSLWTPLSWARSHLAVWRERHCGNLPLLARAFVWRSTWLPTTDSGDFFSARVRLGFFPKFFFSSGAKWKKWLNEARSKGVTGCRNTPLLNL